MLRFIKHADLLVSGLFQWGRISPARTPSVKQISMGSPPRFAIFIDAENLTQWIKYDGPARLIAELGGTDTLVVRKAYGNWSNSGLIAHQKKLDCLGFDLVHSYHPVSGKNSADIEIAVDVMDYSRRDDLETFVLATGDADFSPLFRRLREMGKQVIGVAPHSALSESIKNSCTRFFYVDEKKKAKPAAPNLNHPACQKAIVLAQETLKTFEERVQCGELKNAMLRINPSFNEKSWGFKSFTAFLKSVDGIEVTDFDKVWFAYRPLESLPIEKNRPTENCSPACDPVQSVVYQRILRKQQWPIMTREAISVCLEGLQDACMLNRSQLINKLAAYAKDQVSNAGVKKAIGIFIKAGVLCGSKREGDGNCLWSMQSLTSPEVFWNIDRTMLVRLLYGLEEKRSQLEIPRLRPLLISTDSADQIEKLIQEATVAQSEQKEKLLNTKAG